MAEEQAGPKLADWEILQAKIFSKWCNQKLMSRHFPLISDIRTDLGKDNNLANLMYALTEADVPAEKKKPRKLPMVKVQVLEQIEKALKLVADAGVEMKTKVSSENLYAGDFKDVMALVWGIMLKFIKFDDDEDGENLSATDALLKWLQFHLKDYPQVTITNLTKSFHDGMAFCCLIHKFKPNDIDIAGLSPSNKAANLQLAMDKAEALFEIEQYLTPADIPKLNDKAMLVYCSEYYYQINEQAKRDLAAKRIAKLIRFTQENDAARQQYEADGVVILEHLSKAEALLQGVETITNTMQGAKQHLADFSTYKTSEKRAIVSKHLEMEANYNTLALRLANHNRPAYVPANPELVPATLSARIAALQAKEVVEPALHAELNRQIKLQQLDQRHTASSSKLEQWMADKTTYVAGDFAVSSSGQARQLLTQFEAFEKENASMQGQPLSEVTKLGQTLVQEKFEFVAAVQEREASLKAAFASLTTAATAKKPILQDNLARETFREKTELEVKIHSDVFETINAFNTEKQAYLSVKENITNVNGAYLQLSVLEACMQEIKDMESGNTVRLCTLGQAIRDAKYTSEYSSWTYPKPEEVQALEAKAQGFVTSLTTAAQAKKTVLEDDLAREQFKERVGLMVDNHTSQHSSLKAWAADKQAYLEAKENNQTSQEAKYQLSRLELFIKEKSDMTEGALASLKKLGDEIRAAEYKTEHSQWKYEKPEEVSALETEIATDWDKMVVAATGKQEFLDDALARTQLKASVLLLAKRHDGLKTRLAQYAEAKQKYLETKEANDSLSAVAISLRLLQAFDEEKAQMMQVSFASLQRLGQEVVTTEYSSSLSNWKYPDPDAIVAKENTIAAAFEQLTNLSAEKLVRLKADEDRETYKEGLRHDYAHAAHAMEGFVKDNVIFVMDKQMSKDNLSVSVAAYGFTLQETEAFKAILESENAELMGQAKDLQEACLAISKKLADTGASTNPYTTLTDAGLEQLKGTLKVALDERMTIYHAELARKQANDQLCKDFAGQVQPLVEHMHSSMDKLAKPEGSLEQQLQVVTDAIQTATAHKANIDLVAKMEEDMKAKFINFNPHTTVTVEDLRTQLSDFNGILTYKRPLLEQEIEFKKSRGVTPAQIKEIEDFFAQFDSNNSGNIERKELKACLFSLGEELTQSEVEGYVKKFGSGGKLNMAQFRELMVHLIGVIHTRESIIASFQFIGRDDDQVRLERLLQLTTGHFLLQVDVERLAKVLTPEHLAFVTKTSSPSGGKVAFKPFTDTVFSR
eukprot:m.154704 g.154704  ORF g.154704 m.154704 type:complete len:1268 (-) comp16395_c0_seq1:46-3849(-)